MATPGDRQTGGRVLALSVKDSAGHPHPPSGGELSELPRKLYQLFFTPGSLGELATKYEKPLTPGWSQQVCPPGSSQSNSITPPPKTCHRPPSPEQSPGPHHGPPWTGGHLGTASPPLLLHLWNLTSPRHPHPLISYPAASLFLNTLDMVLALPSIWNGIGIAGSLPTFRFLLKWHLPERGLPYLKCHPPLPCTILLFRICYHLTHHLYT